MPITIARRRAVLLTVLGAAACGRAPAGGRSLRLGTTTTVQQSGMLAVAESLWTDVPLSTVIGPSGQILHAAARGDLDVVLTHAPALERKFLDGGAALERCPFVSSRFAVVGPAADPAGVRGARDAVEAFRRIAARGATFVSRGDSSGTHEREIALWRLAGLAPWAGDRAWYLESGADQTSTLRLADERGAYALGDVPTLATLHDLALRPLFSDDTLLLNRYSLTLVRVPAPHPAARAFFDWALTTWRAHLMGIRLPDGRVAFERLAGACTAPQSASAAGSPR
jgi:tungstate transport system substrate-binding protein